jgi:hypothetical protein
VAVLNPITSPARWRDFAVLDLEWVPGEALPLPENTLIEIEGMRESFTIPLPVGKRQTAPLQLRLAAVYDEITDEDDDGAVSAERYQSFTTTKGLLDCLLTTANRGRWFYAHAGGLADMEFVLDEILKEIKEGVLQGLTNKFTLVPATETEKSNGITKHEIYQSTSETRVKASFSGSSAIIVHVIRGKNSWHFCDSYSRLYGLRLTTLRYFNGAPEDRREPARWSAHAR